MRERLPYRTNGKAIALSEPSSRIIIIIIKLNHLYFCHSLSKNVCIFQLNRYSRLNGNKDLMLQCHSVSDHGNANLISRLPQEPLWVGTASNLKVFLLNYQGSLMLFVNCLS